MSALSIFMAFRPSTGWTRMGSSSASGSFSRHRWDLREVGPVSSCAPPSGDSSRTFFRLPGRRPDLDLWSDRLMDRSCESCDPFDVRRDGVRGDREVFRSGSARFFSPDAVRVGVRGDLRSLPRSAGSRIFSPDAVRIGVRGALRSLPRSEASRSARFFSSDAVRVGVRGDLRSLPRSDGSVTCVAEGVLGDRALRSWSDGP